MLKLLSDSDLSLTELTSKCQLGTSQQFGMEQVCRIIVLFCNVLIVTKPGSRIIRFSNSKTKNEPLYTFQTYNRTPHIRWKRK